MAHGSRSERSERQPGICTGTEDQLMSLDALGKPVVAAKAAKASNAGSSRLKGGSSTCHSAPSQKQKGSASGNKSTAASQGTAVKQRVRSDSSFTGEQILNTIDSPCTHPLVPSSAI